MAVVVVIGIRGTARKPYAETVQRRVDARNLLWALEHLVAEFT
jgi:hypothetical protein